MKAQQGELPAMPEQDEVGKRASRIAKIEDEIEELKEKRAKEEEKVVELLEKAGRKKISIGSMTIAVSYTSAKKKVVVKRA